MFHCLPYSNFAFDTQNPKLRETGTAKALARPSSIGLEKYHKPAAIRPPPDEVGPSSPPQSANYFSIAS